MLFAVGNKPLLRFSEKKPGRRGKRRKRLGKRAGQAELYAVLSEAIVFLMSPALLLRKSQNNIWPGTLFRRVRVARSVAHLEI